MGPRNPKSVPEYLLSRRGGEYPLPPVDTTAQLLPFSGLAWEDFERLCLRLAWLEGEPEHVQLFGTRGQQQAGIDIYSRLADLSYATYQCKRHVALREGDLRAAVQRFLGGEWAAKSSRFVFCTSASAVRAELAAAIERLAAELRARHIGFDVWDAQVLSLKLKETPELVGEFFGDAWLDRFLGIRSYSSRAEVTHHVQRKRGLRRRATGVLETADTEQVDAGLRTSRVCRVGEAAWRALGIAPAIALSHDANQLTPFVPRTVFESVLARVRSGLAMLGPTVVVLEGKPAAGKTRLAFEAVRKACPEAWLVAPASADDARRLFHPLAHSCIRSDPKTPVVLWLDDLETFTRSNGLGLSTSHLDQLRVEKRPVIVMCTIGGKGVDVARDMLDERTLGDLVALAGSPIVVERRLDGSEVSAAQAILGISASASLFTTGLGPFLVGATKIIEAWRSGKHAGNTAATADIVAESLCLLDGALAAGLRAGFGDLSLDERELKQAWDEFRGPDRGIHGRSKHDAFVHAVDWCTAEVSVGHPLLRQDGRRLRWKLSEVLVEYVREKHMRTQDMITSYRRNAEWIEEEVGRRYDYERGRPVDRPPYGDEALRLWPDVELTARIARRLGRLDVELYLYEQSVGDTDEPHPGRVKLSVALLSVGENDRSAAHLECAADAGDTLAHAILAHQRTGDLALAAVCTQCDSTCEAERLADLMELAEDRRLHEMVGWLLGTVIAKGGGAALSAIGQSMVVGRLSATRLDEVFSAVLTRGGPRHCGDLGETLLEASDLKRAEPLLKRAIEASPKWLFDLGELLAAWPGRAPEAVDYLIRGADFGDPRAMQSLAALYAVQLGRAEEAESIYRRAAAWGYVWAFDGLADHLSTHRPEARREIEELRNRAADLRTAGRPYGRHAPLFLRRRTGS